MDNKCNLIQLEKEILINWVTKTVVVHGAMGCAQKSFKPMWRCHQLVSGFLANGHLPRVLCQSLSANNRGNNEMISGLCSDLLEFALKLRKIPEKIN